MLSHVCKLTTKIDEHRTTLSPCLDKALLFKEKKVKEGKAKENNLTKVGV